ncbi:hypothetical protein AAFF_G00234070 [Aldrovandia affinis]|uniref:Uncharacterized protein n=1 Tax=Aldrovandia affinis TaxID=143900 RepID=A0AAD7REX7_9TELE|nr:hypothetical protein AAFF_G00234070 [Aldrovandia affinis]
MRVEHRVNTAQRPAHSERGPHTGAIEVPLLPTGGLCPRPYSRARPWPQPITGQTGTPCATAVKPARRRQLSVLQREADWGKAKAASALSSD